MSIDGVTRRDPSRRRWLADASAGAAALAGAIGALGTLGSGCTGTGGLPPAGGTTTGGPGSSSPGGAAGSAAGAAAASTVLPAAEQPPPDPRELRAAWVASVNFIDWPSKGGLTAAALRAEATAILDRAAALKLNALILQVRPSGDAFFPSTLEPWSEFASGTQGRPPWANGEAPWDPLAWWVEQAHRRGLELHAWFNPLRARHSAAKSPLVAPHLGVTAPQLVRRYGDQLWMDPAEPAVARHTLAVVADVVRRYDIDAVHIDDYFYPYPVPTAGPGSADLPFPDDEAWVRYVQGGGTLARDDWRRENVSMLVKALHETIKSIKPHVAFGISPFGLPRPDRRPPGITGFSQYDRLYADVERWFEAGWLDALVPQLYWPLDRTEQAFVPLLEHWVGENRMKRHVWAGMFTSLVRPNATDALGPRSWAAREILDQVAATRARAPGASGHVHFSMKALMEDRDGLATLLGFGPYAQAALVPATPWIPLPAPPPPRLAAAAAGRVRLEPVSSAAAMATARWAVWRRIDGRWSFDVRPAQERAIDAPRADAVVVSAVGRNGLTSERTAIRL